MELDPPVLRPLNSFSHYGLNIVLLYYGVVQEAYYKPGPGMPFKVECTCGSTTSPLLLYTYLGKHLIWYI